MNIDFKHKSVTQIFCIVSAILYAISCFMPTGIGVETGSENLPGWACVAFGFLTIIMPLYIPCWLSNFMYYYALALTFREKKLDRAFKFAGIAFVISAIFIVVHIFTEKEECRYPNYACYIWSLSYFMLLWGITHQKLLNSEFFRSWTTALHVFGCVVSLILILGIVNVSMKYNAYAGTPIDSRFEQYRKNGKGVYFTWSAKHPYPYYMKDVNEDAFVVLSKEFAKDDKHAWNRYELMRHVDPATFYVGETGIPKDAKHVYWWYRDGNGFAEYRPIEDEIDVASAEYFIKDKSDSSLNEYDVDWIRDSKHTYYCGRMTEADPLTLKEVGWGWYADHRNLFWQYGGFKKIDSLRTKPENLIPFSSGHLRNGNSIIYRDSILFSDIKITRFESPNFNLCIINDMLFDGPEQILKGRINVNKLRVFDYNIFADDQHVYHGKYLLKGVDAATFEEEGKYGVKFRDKNREYIYNPRANENEWPFVAEKKD